MLVSESLNEFRRGIEPKKALDIGLTRSMKSKAWKILEFIGSKGDEGASFTEIQHYIYVDINGNSEEDFWKKGDDNLRSSRGYYATNLYGGGYFSGGQGLLNQYCRKNQKGKWVLDRMPGRKERIY